MKKEVLKKKKKGGTEIPNSVAILILAVVAGSGWLYLNGWDSIFGSTKTVVTNTTSQSSAKGVPVNAVTTMTEENGTKVYTHKMPNPSASGAPVMILPDIKELSLYRSDRISKSIDLDNANQDAAIAEAQLKAAEAKKRKNMLDGESDDSNYFGEGKTKPALTSTPMDASAFAQLMQAANAQTEKPEDVAVSSKPNTMKLVSISRLNGELEAMFNYGGEPVSINRNGVSYSSASNLPAIKVRSLSENEVCLIESRKTNCYKVY